MSPQETNRRRTDREEGIRLLFGAAQDVARRQGLLGDGVLASEANSSLERGRFKLRDQADHLIAAIPVQDARDMLAYRRDLAREVMQAAGITLNSRNPASQERGKLRILNPESRALAWAISTGRRVPYRRKQRWEPAVAVLLLLCGVIPGVAYILWLSAQQRASNRELAALVKRWQAAGKPEPASSFFELYGH
jgi:hypothetical protein